MRRHLPAGPRAAFALALLGAALVAQAAGPRAPAQRLLDVPLAAASLARVDGRLWVASRGGGLVSFEGGARSARFDLGSGLPSAVVHDLAALPDGRLLAGTDRGLVLIDARDPRKGSSRPISPPATENTQATAADLVLAAPRGVSAIFQLTPVDQAAESQPASSLWRWDGTRVTPWDPQLGPGLVATAGLADRGDGCLHLAGVQAERGAQGAWYARDCGGKPSGWRLSVGAPRHITGVAGLARAADGRSMVMVVVTQATANPASRRHLVMQMDEDGRLAAHCSGLGFAERVTGLVRHGPDLVVARWGVGVQAVGCGLPRPVADDPRLRHVTALASDAQAGLLVGTDAAVLQLKDGTSPVVIAPTPDPTLPVDALPMQANAAGSRVLLSSPSRGLLELERGRDTWRMTRQWRAGAELPPGVFGPAAYANDGDDGAVIAVVLSQSLLRLPPGQAAQALDIRDGAAPSAPLDVAPTPGGLWVASGSTPFSGAGAGLHFIANDKATRFVPLPDKQAQPSGRLLAWPNGRVWVGTRIGIVEAEPGGASRRVSGDRVEALYRNASSGLIGAVGATVQRWDGERMLPVLFAATPRAAGHPVDLVIDDAGRWLILYSGGQLVLLDDKREFVATLGEASGIPPSSRRLLYLPKTRELLIGTAREGVFVLPWP
jgi:hypothetical protein